MGALRKQFKCELQNVSAANLATHQEGSKELKEALETLIEHSPIYLSPNRHILRAYVAFIVAGVNPDPLLKRIEDGRLNILVPPPWMDAQADEENISFVVSFSPYHSKSDVLEFIRKNWNRIETEKNKHKKSKLKQDRAQPFTDFERDLNILSDKESGLTYNELMDKYKLEFDTVKMIVRKLRKRIRSLYTT